MECRYGGCGEWSACMGGGGEWSVGMGEVVSGV